MTQLTQTQIRYPARTVAGIALAAVVLGGIVGGGVQALTHASSDGIPAVSARDQAVLKAAQEWEARYRQIYPSSR
jgi:uncharacterized membrane protein